MSIVQVYNIFTTR